MDIVSVDEIGGSACGATEDQHTDGDWELEMRACNAANATLSVTEYQQLTRDLWKAYCDMEERAETASAMAEALARIERWFGEFPSTGSTWDDGSPVSYAAAYGSNGERDFMRSVARTALQKAGIVSPSEASAGNAGLDDQ